MRRMDPQRTLRLVRIERTLEHTIGRLTLPDGSIYSMMENPWKRNAKNVSCLSVGNYRFFMKRSPKYGLRYHLDDAEIAPRSHCLMHAGNWVKNTLGCLMPGLRDGWLDGVRAVLNSGDALRDIEERLDGGEYVLEISNAPEVS